MAVVNILLHIQSMSKIYLHNYVQKTDHANTHKLKTHFLYFSLLDLMFHPLSLCVGEILPTAGVVQVLKRKL